jgi:hypothetical protein
VIVGRVRPRRCTATRVAWLLAWLLVPQLTLAEVLPAGVEFQVNTYTTDFQFAPSVAADAAGNFVAVWESRYQDGSRSGVFGQRYASNGAPQGTEFQVNTYTTSLQYSPAVAADDAP